MPSSSPKSFYPRPPPRRTTFLILTCLFLSLSAFFFAFLRPLWDWDPPCSNRTPTSVRVLWDHRPTAHHDPPLHHRHKVIAFVGIQTGFGSVGRRQSLRNTWFPSDPHALQGLEEATGLAFRFVVGRTSDRSKMSALQKEVAQYDDFILLDIEEEYSKLPYKTLAFFKAAYALFEADFYVKADDDIYLRPDRLSLRLAKERSHPQTYIGCMKKGPVFTDPKLKWHIILHCFLDILIYISEDKKPSLEVQHLHTPIQPNKFDCGVIVLKIMELWDDIEKYERNTMPSYTTEELQQVREQYVCQWILDVDNVRRNQVLEDLGIL